MLDDPKSFPTCHGDKDTLALLSNLQILQFLSDVAIVQFDDGYGTSRYYQTSHSSLSGRAPLLAPILAFLEGQVAVEIENFRKTITTRGETGETVADQSAVFQAWRHYHTVYSLEDLQVSLDRFLLLDNVIVRLGAALGEEKKSPFVYEKEKDAVDAASAVRINETISTQDARSNTFFQAPVYGGVPVLRVKATFAMTIIVMIISFVNFVSNVTGSFSYHNMAHTYFAYIVFDLMQCITSLMVVQSLYIMTKRMQVFIARNNESNDRNRIMLFEYMNHKSCKCCSPYSYSFGPFVSHQHEENKGVAKRDNRCVGGWTDEVILRGSKPSEDSGVIERIGQSLDVGETLFNHSSGVYDINDDEEEEEEEKRKKQTEGTFFETDANGPIDFCKPRKDVQVTIPCFLKCLQAPREMPQFFAERASGVGLQKIVPHADCAAKICRALTENLYECLCPLVVVECHRSSWSHASTHTEPRGTSRTAFPARYSVVYSSLAAIDILRCRWSTDLAGKELRSVFTLYRTRSRSPQRKAARGSAKPSLPNFPRSVSALPALPQARTPSNLHVPMPPPTKRVAVLNRRLLEEIADTQCLFENGAQESITVLATQTGAHFDVYAMGTDVLTLPQQFCDQREGEQQQQQQEQRSSVETFDITATEIGSGVDEVDKGNDSKLYLVMLFVRPVERDELEPHQEQPQKQHHQYHNQQQQQQLKSLLSQGALHASKKLSIPARTPSTRTPSTRTVIIPRTSIDSTRFAGSVIGISESNLRRASTAKVMSVPPPFPTIQSSEVNAPASTSLCARPNSRHRVLSAAKRTRRRTTRMHEALLSAERGRTVDRFTPQQLKEKLESLAAVHEVKVTSNVPDSFFFNFMALMILFQKILKQCGSVICHVDAENMEICLEILVCGKKKESLSDDKALSSLNEVVLIDGKRNTEDSYTALTPDSVLSPDLIEYMHVCDASLQFLERGCVLRLPYITQERLDLMEDMTILQLSKAKSLSLFGIAAANALAEEAVAKTSEEKQCVQHTHHAGTDETVSDAMQKANPLASLHDESSKSPKCHEFHIDEIYGSSVSFFGVQPLVEEETSSQGSACGLPMIIGGRVQKNMDAASLAAVSARTRATVTAVAAMQPTLVGHARKRSNTPEAPQSKEPLIERTGSKTESETAVVVSDTAGRWRDSTFGKPLVRSASEALSISTLWTGNFCNYNQTGSRYSKRFLHVFLFVKEARADVLQHLSLQGHLTTTVTEPALMQQYIMVGLHVFDVIFLEWSEKIVTPEIRELITPALEKHAATFFILTENEQSPPLPAGTPDSAVLRIRDIADVFTDANIGHNISAYIRRRQLRCEMVRVRWPKNYQIVKKLGGGAFGDVFEVYLYVSHGRLAMKRFLLNGVNERMLDQLNREVLIMSQLDHTNIVSFSHTSVEDNSYCIFMELCDGTLAQRIQAVNASPLLKEQHQEQVPGVRSSRVDTNTMPIVSSVSDTSSFRGNVIPPPPSALSLTFNPTSNPSECPNKLSDSLTAREIVLLLRDIATGLAHIHSQGIVHRDIKPCNILFVNGVAKIADFGSAAEERAASPLMKMKGTLSYMSPEVLLGEPYGKPCDMWSFGCLIAEVMGLRLGHLHGLHMPALVELYRSIPLSGSLPVTVANHHGTYAFQSHYGDSTASQILGAMKSAILDSGSERLQASFCGAGSRRMCSSASTRGGSLMFVEGGEKGFRTKSGESKTENDANRHSSINGEVTRSVTYISTTSTCFLSSEKAQLPESLVELLEGLFCRDPQKRMTAENILDHPVTWDAEWMEMILQAVEDICPHDGVEPMGNASACTDILPQEEILDLSFSSGKE